MSAQFSATNLPFGVADHPQGGEPRVFVAFGDDAIDLHACRRRGLLGTLQLPPDVFAQPSLNPYMACGRQAWRTVRSRVAALVAEGALPRDVVVPRRELSLGMPIDVADYVDFYAGIHHATNLGRILRPDTEPLLPNYTRIPVAYHGRAGTVVVSGTDIVRPQVPVLDACGECVARPTAMLDVEVELGAVVGTPSTTHTGLPFERALDHVFGFVIVNDWSARDVQSFEYQPLGPFLGKSFATTISPWVVPFDALAPHLVTGMSGDGASARAPYLRNTPPSVPDVHLQWSVQSAAMRAGDIAPTVVGRVDAASALYWSVAQMLAHLTVNGAPLRTGDLVATGTLSGTDRCAAAGSLIERTWRGHDPIVLPTGERRAFLEDGDHVAMTAWAGDGAARVDFGELHGAVVGARSAGLDD